MMDDNKLIELAAKAAGYRLSKRIYEDCDGTQKIQEYTRFNENGSRGDWNPLKYSGDALELAVKLEMALDLTVAMQKNADVAANEQNVDCNSDPYAATRRAIVRAAVVIELGRVA